MTEHENMWALGMYIGAASFGIKDRVTILISLLGSERTVTLSAANLKKQ